MSKMNNNLAKESIENHHSPNKFRRILAVGGLSASALLLLRIKQALGDPPTVALPTILLQPWHERHMGCGCRRSYQRTSHWHIAYGPGRDLRIQWFIHLVTGCLQRRSIESTIPSGTNDRFSAIYRRSSGPQTLQHNILRIEFHFIFRPEVGQRSASEIDLFPGEPLEANDPACRLRNCRAAAPCVRSRAACHAMESLRW